MGTTDITEYDVGTARNYLPIACIEDDMDFEVHYTDQQQNFRTKVRQWLETNVPEQLRHASEHDESDESYRMRRDLGRNLAKQGWLYPMAPPQYGGGGLDVDSAM